MVDNTIDNTVGVAVKGHVKIVDDLGTVILDKDNSIHPQNQARVIARALSNENNFSIYRVGFGNGGTIVDAALNISYKTSNDGQSPDPTGWESRLYNETYYEIIDDSNVNIGSGSAGAVPEDDPVSVEHVSGPGVRSAELGLSSTVEMNITLNPGEPTGQFITDDLGPLEDPESEFTFDEIGLFTSGLPPTSTPGRHRVNVSNKLASDSTGLVASTFYQFDIAVDGGLVQTISFTTTVDFVGSGPLGEFLFQDIVNEINSQLVGATVGISDNVSVQTFGYLQFTSLTSGSSSSIVITDSASPDFLFSNILGFIELETPEIGLNAGIQNSPATPANERERLLSHVIFSPIVKSANRTFTITYTLTVSVARSV